MSKGRLAGAIAVVLCLHTAAMAAMDSIKNPADRLKNPADRMYNPATQINNPATNIYNPATRLDNPEPLSPPVPQAPPSPVTPVTTPAKPAEQSEVKPVIPRKSYYFKKVKEYFDAAKKAFAKDDYAEFLSITEDALRRIDAGTLKASPESRQKLARYKTFGYGLLGKNEE